jgi:integrase
MTIETYSVRPRGQKVPVTKYRVRIRTTLPDLMSPDENARLKHVVDEIYDSYHDAKKAHDAHWGSIRSGEAATDVMALIEETAAPTMSDLLDEYADEQLKLRAESSRDVEELRLRETIPNLIIEIGLKAGDIVRRNKLQPDGRSVRFGDVLCHQCHKRVIKSWIHERSKSVAAATVRRELGLISAAFDRFRDLFPSRPPVENPCKLLHKSEKPRLPRHRERVITHAEEKTLLDIADKGTNPGLALAIRVALGTAMRRGDILSLDWSHIHWDVGTISIPDDKASEAGHRRQGRSALMMPGAREALEVRWNALDKPTEGAVINMTLYALKSAWVRLQRKVFGKDDKQADRDNASGKGGSKEDGDSKEGRFTFHDLRHTCISRAAASGWSPIQVKSAFDVVDIEHLEKRFFSDKPAQAAAKALRERRTLTMDELAAIGGHADKSMAATYANLTAEDLTAGTMQPQPQEHITVRKGEEGFVAEIDGIEFLGNSAKEAVALARGFLSNS